MGHWESRQRSGRVVARPFPLGAALRELRDLYRELARARAEIARVGRTLSALEKRWNADGGTVIESGKGQLTALRKDLATLLRNERLPRLP